MSTPARSTGSSSVLMASLLAVGLALQVAGCITVFEQIPRTQIEPLGPVEVGHRGAVLVGVLGFGLGGVLSLTAVVAFGVLLGLRAYGAGGAAHDEVGTGGVRGTS